MLHLDAALRHKLVAPGIFWLHGSMAQHLTVPRASNASMARHAKSVVLRQAHQRDLRRFTSQEVMDLPFKKWQTWRSSRCLRPPNRIRGPGALQATGPANRTATGLVLAFKTFGV